MELLQKMIIKFLKRYQYHQRWKKALMILVSLVVFVTTYAMILPAVTLEADKSESVGMVAEPAPKEPITLISEGTDYTVTMTCPAEAEIPDDASLSVQEIIPDTGEYKDYLDEAAAVLKLTENEVIRTRARFFDITIMDGEAEITPAAPVRVEITYHEVKELAQAGQMNAVHFAENGQEVVAEVVEEVSEVKDEQTEEVSGVSFETDSFSVYGVVYTVDFNWEMDGKTYEFTLPGGGFVSFGTLAGALGIAAEDVAAFVGDVESVAFSNPGLVWTGKIDEETTVGALKVKNGLTVQHSSELTQEQIAEIEAQTAAAGDWALISLRPFDTEESMTVTMKNGETFTVRVTDLQLTTKVISASGEKYEITVTCGPETGIPENAELLVRELGAEAESYGEYVAKTESALGLEAGSADYIRLFDIKIVDRDDPGIKYQPAEGSNVDVKIELADAGSGSLKVVHFADAQAVGDVVENNVEKDENSSAVEFEANGFSVYVVVDHEGGTVVTPRVEFHFIDKYTNAQYAAGVSDGTPSTPYNFVNEDGTYQTTQILTNGETLELITNPSNIQIDNEDGITTEKYFYGWYLVNQSSDTTSLDSSTGKYSGSIVYTWPENPDQIQFEKAISIEVNGNDLTWTMDGVTGTGTMDSEGTVHVYLAPLYEDFYFINFHKGPKEDETGIANSLMARKLVVFGSADSTSVRIGNVICDSPDPTHKIFSGWETITENNETDTYYQTVHHVTDETGSLENEEVANPEGADGYYITVNKTDSDVTVLDFYPVFDEARWLYFNTGTTGNGASYVGAAFRLTNDERQQDEDYYFFDNTFFTGDDTAQSHMSSRPGYTQEGWYLFANVDADGNITNLDEAQDVTVKYLDSADNEQTTTINTKAIKVVNSEGVIQNIGTWYVAADGTISQSASEGCRKLFEVDADGKLRFYKAMNDMTFFANWIAQPATYRVIIWRQKVTDDVNTSKTPVDLLNWLAEDSTRRAENYPYPIKDYDYEIFYVSDPVSGSAAPVLNSFSGEDAEGNTVSSINLLDLSYTGFHYSDDDAAVVGTPNPDGTTVYNVYYDRDVHRLFFQGSGNGYSYSVTTGSTIPQYAFIDGEWVELTRGQETGTLTEYFLTRTNGGTTEYTGTVYDSNGNSVSNPVYGTTYYRTRNSMWGTFTGVQDPLYWNSRTVNSYEWLIPEYGDVYTASIAYEEVMYGEVDGEYVELTPVYETTTATTDIYKLTSTLTAGSDYLIVSRNSAGSGEALGHNAADKVEEAVTVNAGTTASDNTVYILASDVDGTSVWRVTSGFRFFNNYGGTSDYYIKGATGNSNITIATGDNNNNWTWNNGNLRYNGNGSYLRYRNSNFTCRNSSTSGNAIYLYIKDTIPVTTTAITGYKYNDEEYTGTRYTKSYGETGTAVYSGTRYTRASGTPTVYVIEALYGQTISGYFPIPGYTSGERWSPGDNSQGWNQVMVVVDTMPDEDITFTVSTSTNTEKTMNYYVEALPGQTAQHTYNGIGYVLYNTVKARYNYITSEDFLDLTGFIKNGSYPTINGNTYLTNYNDTINFYYLREEFDLTFDVNYPVDANLVYSNGQSSNLTVSDIYYQYPLTEYGSAAVNGKTNWYYGVEDADNTADNPLVGPDHYIFGGWYEDASCTVPFNFNGTMPAANKIVYAKWTPEVFLIKVDPNGGEIDHINHNGYASFGDNFASINVDYKKYPLPGVSNYNRNQSTYIRTEYNEVVSEYSVPRRFVAMSDQVASEYEAGGGTVYYYMNYQWRSTDGASGIYSDIRSALYLKEEELEDYYELYKEVINYSLSVDPEANTGMTLLDYDTWKSLYVSSEKYRPLNSNESWTFLGWYKDDDTMPYNFSDPVTGPFTLTAHWRLDGGYSIQYVPQYTMPDGAEINGAMSAWRDPEDINTTYADGAETEIYKQPTDLTKDGETVTDDSVIFRGWALVSKTGTDENPVYTPLEVDEDGNITTYYNPSDAYTVNAANAGTDSTIYFQAVYQYKEASDRRPEITNLILDANTGYVNTSDSSDLPEWDCYPGVSAVNTEDHLDSDNNPTQIEFGDIQSSAAVHLYKYATDAGVIAEDGQNFFTHPEGYFLLGFDDEPTEGDCIATYPADSVIAVTRDDNQTIYAVWEPMVYVTFENETTGTVTFGLNSEDSTALSVINIKDGLYERQALTDYGNITLQAGESITLAFPNGAEKGITVSGTNTLGTGKVLEWNTSLDLAVNGTTTRYDTADEENPAYSYTHTTDTEHSHDLAYGEKNNTQDFSFSETLIVNENPLVVTFTERDNAYALILEDNYPSAVGSSGNTQEIDYTSDQVLTDSEPSGAKTQELPSANTCLGYKFLGWAYTADATEAVYKAGNWTIEELETFFEVGETERTYTTTTEGGTVVRTLYAVWEINSESNKVYVYKDVPSPGNQNQSFTFDVSLSARYSRNYNDYSVSDSGSFTLKHNQYAVLNTSQDTATSPVNITTTVTIYNVADDSRVNTALDDEPDYTFTASHSTADTGGTFSDIDISVTEQSAEYYDTSMKRLAQTNDGTLELEGTQISADPLTVTGNKISWDRVEQGGTVIYTNQRQTFDITLAKNLISNTSAAVAFNYTASYTDSYTDNGNTVTTTTALEDFAVTSGSSKVLEDIPAGTTLTITETADENNNYIVSAASAEGASDSDSSDNGFAFNVTQDDTITYTNTLKSYPVTFRLVDQDGNTTINAMFSLASSTGSLGTDLYANASSTSNPGVFYTSSKLWADTYTLNQTTIPSGYIGLTDDVTLTVTGEGITSDNEFVTVTGDAENGYVITVKNWAEKDVDITKILSDPLLTSTREFGFSYSYTSPVNGETVTGTFTLSPTSNDASGSVKTLRIPVNATDFKVTELTTGSYATVPDRYTTVAAGVYEDDSSITDTDESDYIFAFSDVNASAAVTFTNTARTRNVTVKKLVSDETDETEFDFTLTLLNGAHVISGYTVYEGAGDSDNSLTTGTNGQVTFKLKHNEEIVFTIPAGAKIVVTETVPSGYTPTASMANIDDNSAVTDADTAAESFTVNSVTEDGIITFTNMKGIPVQIVKTDQSGNALEGAVFSISGENISDETGLTSSIPESGSYAVIYENDTLPTGTYTLTETETPSGYIPLEGSVTIEVSINSTNGQIIVTPTINGQASASATASQIDINDLSKGWIVIIMNSTGVSLPATGGTGTLLFTLAGMLLAALAAAGLLLKRKLN